MTTFTPKSSVLGRSDVPIESNVPCMAAGTYLQLSQVNVFFNRIGPEIARERSLKGRWLAWFGLKVIARVAPCRLSTVDLRWWTQLVSSPSPAALITSIYLTAAGEASWR